MAKRYGIFPIIGDGQSTETAYRSEAADESNCNASSVIPTDQQGEPVWNFAFTRFATASVASVGQISNSYIFPDYPLDGELSGMESEVRTAMKQSVEAYDLDGQGTKLSVDISDTSRSYRDLLVEDVYQGFDSLLTAANFDNFDVNDPE